MKQNPPRFARAALLLATAALPFAPLAAQDTQPAPPPPAAQQQPVDVPAPPAPAATPAPAERPAPAAQAQAQAPAAEAPAPAPRPAPVRVVRTAPRIAPAPRAVTVAPAPVAAPASSSVAPPVAATTTVPPATVSPTAPAEPIAAAPASGVDTVPPPAAARQQPTLDQRTATWPWFLLGALLIGGGALLFARRRRARTDVYEDSYAPVHEVAPVPEPVAVAPPAEVLPAAAAAAPEPQGEPEIALLMRPHRAGVAGDDARVQFELTVDNRGSAPARDLRVSTWMLAAGSSEAERALSAPREAADTPPLTIDAGEARTMQAEVALSRGEIEGDALLPVVVADARYVLPDGREAHATARFTVGVPNGEELAWFDLEHPSGLHDGVVAQPLGEAERS
jgi:hypothetical protein